MAAIWGRRGWGSLRASGIGTAPGSLRWQGTTLDFLRIDYDWHAPVHGIYCERVGDGVLGEPLNAGSSLLVALAGIAVAVHLHRSRRMTPLILLLTALAVAIGIGSFLWHTFATRWAEALDVVPIWALISVYGAAMLPRAEPHGLFGRGVAIAAIAVIFLVGTGISMSDELVVGDAFSGSSQYLPAVALFVVMLKPMIRQKHVAVVPLAGAAGLFALSLAFRSLDQHVCPYLPSGTHFLWHLTNCGVFLLLLAALIRRRPEDGQSAPPEPVARSSAPDRTALPLS